jgi:Tol biopolymer transport system component
MWSSALAWSPDGKQIVFFATQNDNLELYRYDFEDGEVLRLTDNTTDDRYPMWRPG